MKLSLFAQDIRFEADVTGQTAGQIAVESRCLVRATSTLGNLIASVGGETKSIGGGDSYQIRAEEGVQYRESWRPVLQDYPTGLSAAKYHESHSHVACLMNGEQDNRGPAKPAKEGHFKYAAAIAVGLGTTIVIHKIMESGEKP
jgi:hypothetical protein